MQHNKPSIDKAFYEHYYNNWLRTFPSQVLTNFLQEIKRDLRWTLAVDIGVGSWHDTKLLLERGAKVFAIDGNIWSYQYMSKNISSDLRQSLDREQQRLEDLNLPKNQLIFSGKTLGLVQPDKFQEMMHRVTDSIQPGGYFVWNFFGPRCSESESRIKLSEEQVLSLFEWFNIVECKPSYAPRVLNSYTMKHEVRELQNIIAQKK